MERLEASDFSSKRKVRSLPSEFTKSLLCPIANTAELTLLREASKPAGPEQALVPRGSGGH